MRELEFPGGKRFAFTVLDDTDGGTVERIAPVYDLFEELGMRVTKTVWPVACPEGTDELPGTGHELSQSLTLEAEDYRAYVLGLKERGFEIASHGATFSSSTRERTLAGLTRYRELFGTYPRTHANHSLNRENLYWGAGRIDDPLLRALYTVVDGGPRGHYQGHVEGSPYWWGDLCAEHIEYVRNLTFDEINLARMNPSMPYHDPRRPLVRWWFSAADADDAGEFNELIRPEAQARLEEEGGFCIVATHLGKRFAREGKVNPRTRELLTQLAVRPGWFPAVSELLDWLRDRRPTDLLPSGEWRRMQWQWALHLYRRRAAGMRERSARRDR